MFDVIIAGAGPVGLWLAGELALAGVSVVVLERSKTRSIHSKALTMHPRTVELFGMRGIADKFLAHGQPVPSSHYGLMANRLDYRGLDTPYPYVLFLPQLRTEELMETHILAAGVQILREHEVAGLSQDDQGVEVEARTPTGAQRYRGKYLVGCDGAGSAVRKAANIGFPGLDATVSCMLGDVALERPPSVPALTMNKDAGALYLVQLGPDRYRLATIDQARLHVSKDEPVTLEELQESVLRCTGIDFGLHSPTWLSRVGDATRQAERYRLGRVFLAGDAAHIHWPMGGQGLNLGLQDATNLGWKLAAAIKGWAPEGLLDSYQTERHAVGDVVVRETLAQTSLVISRTPHAVALRDRINELVGELPALNEKLAVRLSGLDLAYPSKDGDHPLSGQRMPDLALEGAPAANAFALMASGRHVLIDLTGSGGLVLGEFEDRLLSVSGRLKDDRKDWRNVGAALIRPDGYVAWASDEQDPAKLADETKAATRRLLGAGAIKPATALRHA